MLFISYSRADGDLANEVVRYLEEHGIDYWLDRTSVPPGEAFVEMIASGLYGAWAYLLIDTPKSRSSYWVARERDTAHHLRQEGLLEVCVRLSWPPYPTLDSALFDLDLRFEPCALDTLVQGLLRSRTSRSEHKYQPQYPSVAIFQGIGLNQPRNWAGQQAMLAELDSWWASTDKGCWIIGHGGIGKTGLLQTWTAVLRYLRLAGSKCKGIVFVKASILSREIEKQAVAHLALLSQDSLLVVDGYDEASDRNVCDDLINSPLVASRMLVTSREPPPGSARTQFRQLALSGLRHDDAADLLMALGASRSVADGLAAAVGHLPLALQLLQGQIDRGARPEVLLQDLQVLASDLSASNVAATKLEAALQGAIDSLSQGARNLLDELVVAGDFGTPLSSRTEKFAEELRSRSLITVARDHDTHRANVHPMVWRIVLSLEQGAS